MPTYEELFKKQMPKQPQAADRAGEFFAAQSAQPAANNLSLQNERLAMQHQRAAAPGAAQMAKPSTQAVNAQPANKQFDAAKYQAAQQAQPANNLQAQAKQLQADRAQNATPMQQIQQAQRDALQNERNMAQQQANRQFAAVTAQTPPSTQAVNQPSTRAVNQPSTQQVTPAQQIQQAQQYAAQQQGQATSPPSTQQTTQTAAKNGPNYNDLQNKMKYTSKQTKNGTVYTDTQGNSFFVRAGTTEISPNSSGYAAYANGDPTSPDTYYNNALNQGQTAYDAQTAKLKAAQEAAAKQLQANREYSEGILNRNLDSAMQQASIQQRQQQKGLNQQLAALGVKGGGSEQAYSNMLNAYQQTRGGAQSGFDSAMGSLSNEHNNNLARMQEAYMNRDADLVGKMYDQAREDAKWRETYDNDNMWRGKNFDEDTRRYNQDFGEGQRQFNKNWDLSKAGHDLEADQWKAKNEREGLATEREGLKMERDEQQRLFENDMKTKGYNLEVMNAVNAYAAQLEAAGKSPTEAYSMARSRYGV